MAQNPWDSDPIVGAGALPAPPPDPLKLEDQAIQREAAARAARAEQRAVEAHGAAMTKLKGAGTLVVPDTAAKRTQADVGSFVSLDTAANTFKDDYGGNLFGGLENTAQAYSPIDVGTPGQREWWAAFNATDNQIRNDLFGSALTAPEKAAYEATTIAPGMQPEIIRQNVTRRAEIIKGALARQREFMIANGYKPEAVDALFAPILAGQEGLASSATAATDDKLPPVTAASTDGAAPGMGGPTPPPLSPGDPGYQAASGGQRRVDDPETQGQVDAMLRQGKSYAEINEYAQSRGMAPLNPQEYEAVRAFMAKNPNYQGSLVNASKYEPVSAAEQVITGAGDNPVGTYFLNAGQFLSGNTLDNMTGDPDRARLAVDIGNAQNPTAAALGQVSGGVLAGLTGEAGLARLGMAGGVGRGLLADSAAGAANAAGAADYSAEGTPSTLGDRFLAGGKGAATAVAGNIAGRGLARGIGAAVSPSGGRLRELYDSGVRPSIGQRAAAAEGPVSGPVGRAVGMAEEALQSVPGVGSLIRTTRDTARDQFQVGAFNQALAEIGEELPAGIKAGTAPHAIAQKAFDSAYDKARSGMTLVVDQPLSKELMDLAPDIASLGPAAQSKLKSIMANSVNNRLDNGQMAGESYKKAISVLGKRIASARRGATADDQDLADVLDGVKTAMENAARRHSDKAAVELLDAADAGYAKLVRIEDAAARRGGDDGTFTPAQFAGSVQKTSGGVRSKAFLRGDALMQDYASAGKSLSDKLPNSGSADRVMAGYAVGAPVAAGAVYMDPVAAAVLGTIAALNAPGVRKVVTGAMAPRNSAAARKIAEQLKKRARLVGAAGAASGVAALPGTSPAQ